MHGYRPSSPPRREALDDERGTTFATLSEALADATGADVAGQELKRVPAPFAADHPRAGLLRFKGYQLRWQEDLPSSVDGPDFALWCVARLERTGPIHQWLVELLA